LTQGAGVDDPTPLKRRCGTGFDRKFPPCSIAYAIASVQFYLHEVATLVMCSSLLLMYGGSVPGSTRGPVLGASSVGVPAGAVLIAYMILRAPGSHA
jgi:hypothetical protein